MAWTVWGSNPSRGKFFHAVQTSPKIHPASCTMGTGSFRGIKQLEHGANQSPPSSIAWSGAILLPPLCTYIVISLGDLFKVKSQKRPRKYLLSLYCLIGEVSLDFKVNTLITYREASYLYMSSVLNSIIKSQRFKVVGA